MAFDLIWNGRELVKRFHGLVSVDDFLQAAALIQGDPRFDDLRAVINDLTGCTGLDPSGLDRIKEIAARDAAAALSNPRIRVATVAPLDAFPLAREATHAYVESRLSPLPIGAFDSIDEARLWLSQRD